MVEHKEFKKGTIWKKIFKPDKSYIIFKIVDIEEKKAKIILYKDEKYNLSKDSGGIIIPPYSNLELHEFIKLTEAELFLEVI